MTRPLPVLLLALGLVVGSSPATAHRLEIRLRTPSGEATAARVQVVGPQGDLFADPDPDLRSGFWPGPGPYLHVDGSLDLELPAGPYQVRALQGLTGVPAEQEVDLQQDTTLTLTLDHWIHPVERGWYGADPHVHLDHQSEIAPGVYPPASLAQAALAARAEGLQLLFVLDNHPENPSGAVDIVAPGLTMAWGEEFRSSYWGHVGILGAKRLVTVDGNPWANGPGLPAWPMLSKVLSEADYGVAWLAHPHSAEDTYWVGGWPGSGVARELPVLSQDSVVQAVAVVSHSNGPSGIWDPRPLSDALTAGAHWAAVGESDVSMERHARPPVGTPRTFVQIPKAAALGHPLLERQWQEGLRAGRSFATTGPFLAQMQVEGAGLGGTATLVGTADLSLEVLSPTPLGRITLHGTSGRSWDLPLTPGSTAWQGSITTPLGPGDRALFLEVVAERGGWWSLADSLRLVSSPVYLTGTEPEVPADLARRRADELSARFASSLRNRGYLSAVDSAAAWLRLDQARAWWESLVDDPPGPFRILWPQTGYVAPTSSVKLLWSASRPLDAGETVSYRVAVDVDPQLTAPAWYGPLADTTLVLTDLVPGRRYWWRVRAEESGGQVRWCEDETSDFQVSSQVVDAPAGTTTPLLRLGPARPAAAGVQILCELSRSAVLRLRWVDARGRVVRHEAARDLAAGRHPYRWDGSDDAGRPVAARVYRLVAEAAGERRVRAAVLVR